MNLTNQPYVIPTRTTIKAWGHTLVQEITAERNEQGLFRGVMKIDGEVERTTRWMFPTGGAAKVAMRDVLEGKRTECLPMREQVSVLMGYLVLGAILGGLVYVLM
jgi:hypothetical protein